MNKLSFASALAGLAAVALGAFGAHALKDTLLEHGKLDMWNTAVLYHLGHAIAATALCTAATRQPRARLLDSAVTAWLVGIVLFSGSLYLMALGGPRALGPVTPLGGVAFLTGWTLLAVSACRQSRSPA